MESTSNVLFELDIIPFAKPRMTQRDKWKKRSCVVRYYQFKDALLEKVGGVKTPSGFLSATFIAPMPKSWSKKKQKRMEGVPHEQKPDLDNYIKSLQDILYLEDSKVHTYPPPGMRKIWGVEGKIIIHQW